MAVRIRDHRTPILAALMLTVVIPVYGKLSDLYGRKPVLVIGVLVFLAGSALSAAAWDMLALPLFRALQGRGAGSIGATVNTVAGDLYEVSERGRIQGFLSSVWGISAVVAPAVRGRPDDNRSVADTTGCLQPTKPGKSRTASGRYEPAIELVDMRSQAVDRLGTVDHEVMLSSPNQGWPPHPACTAGEQAGEAPDVSGRSRRLLFFVTERVRPPSDCVHYRPGASRHGLCR